MCVFSFLSTSQEIGWEECLQSDPGVELDFKPSITQLVNYLCQRVNSSGG